MAEYRRGDIWMADLGVPLGSETGGRHPVLILQNNIGNRFSPTLIVAPLTTKTDRKTGSMPTHVIVNGAGLDHTSVVLLEQIRVLDKQRVHRFFGRLTEKQMERVDEAARISLGL